MNDAARQAAARLGLRLTGIERDQVGRRTVLFLSDTSGGTFPVTVTDAAIRSERHPERMIEQIIGERINHMTGPAALAAMERALDEGAGAKFEAQDEERLERMSVRLAEIVDAMRKR